MNKEQLLHELIKIKENYDYHYDEEKDHIEADELLLKYIDDEKISNAFYDIKKWYS